MSAEPKVEAETKPAKGGRVLKFQGDLTAKMARASRQPGFAPTSQPEPSELEVAWIDVDLIDDNPYQYRTTYNQEKMGELVRYINAEGQMQAARVRPHPTIKGRWQLVYGHRRLRTVRDGYYDEDTQQQVYANAGSHMANPLDFIKKLRVEISLNVSDLEMRRKAYSENSGRDDVPVMDNALFYRDTQNDLTESMRKEGTLKEDEVASMRAVATFLNENYRQVSRVANLLKLPPLMAEAIVSGELNERHGRALLLLHEWPDAQRGLFADIRKKGWAGSTAEGVAQERRDLLVQKRPTEESKKNDAESAAEKRKTAKPTPGSLVATRRGQIALVVDEAKTTVKSEVTKTATSSTIAHIESLPVNFEGWLSMGANSVESAANTVDKLDIAPQDRDKFLAYLKRLKRGIRTLEREMKN